MANLGNYDATGGATMEERSVLPAGEYVAALVKSDKKDAKKGNGNAYINCEFEVTDGANKGRRFWTMLNLWNDNPQAVEISQRALNSIMNACGRLRVNDTEELHGIPMRIKLKVKSDSYGEKNEVTSYAPLNAMPGGSSNPPQPSGGQASKPWAR